MCGSCSLRGSVQARSVRSRSVPFVELPNPLLRRNVWQMLSISWLTPLLRLGARKAQLDSSDVWELRPQDRAHACGARFDAALEQCEGQPRPVMRALWRCFGAQYLCVMAH